MRNAVIRKKLLKEQADFRRYFLYPQRIHLSLPAAADYDWTSAEFKRGRLGMWAVAR